MESLDHLTQRSLHQAETYPHHPAEDWRDRQRILPWGEAPPTSTQVASLLAVDPSTVCRWRKAVTPIPLEPAFHLASHFGTQYLMVLAEHYRLPMVFTRRLPLKGPLMEYLAALHAEHCRVIPVLAKVDRGEPLTPDDIQSLQFWQAKAIELTLAIARAAMEKGAPHVGPPDAVQKT